MKLFGRTEKSTGEGSDEAAPRPVANGRLAKRLRTGLRLVGDFLYLFGYHAEYFVLRMWRGVQLVAGFVLPLAGMVFGGIWGWLKALVVGAVRDLKAPFVRFRKKRDQLDRARRRFSQRQARGDEPKLAFFGGVMSNRLQLGVTVLKLMLPVAATVVMAVTVRYVVGMEYGLAVEIDGKVLGHVADQTVVENAKVQLRDRIQLAKGQDVTDWQLTASYSIARTESFTTVNQLANEILLTNTQDAGDIVQATGLYLNDGLYAVTTEGERLQAWLDGQLEQHRSTAPEGAVVSFVRKVECDPTRDDVFFASSVEDYDTLIARLQANVSDELRVSADGATTLGQYAQSHGVTLDELRLRNPLLADAEEETLPEAGTELLIRRAQPFLQVQTAIRRRSIEAIPFNEIEQENPDRFTGVRVVVQEGVEGQQEVWDDYIYVNGEPDSRRRVEGLTFVLSEPVDQIVEVGTREATTVVVPSGSMSYGGGGFVFPVPGSPYSSRGIGANHRGLDINAPTGMAILACADGVVTTAGWHYSYGNYIIIDHGGITTLYAHCSALYVAAGQQVGGGSLIAAVGNTGNSSGSHCHLEIRVGGALVDPVAYVGYPY